MLASLRFRVLLAPLVICFCLATARVLGDEPVAYAIDDLVVAESWPIDFQTHHVQGLCVTADHFYVSSVAREAGEAWILIFDRRGQLLKSRDVTIETQIHPGGMQLVDDTLWIALAEYRPRSNGTILALDASTLATKASFPVDDHVGAVATDGREHVFAANWDSRTIYHFDLQGNLRSAIANPSPVAYQDLEWHAGHLWGVGQIGRGEQREGVVDVLDPADASLLHRYRLLGTTRSGTATFGREGFTRVGDNLFVLPEDGPYTTVYRFELPASSGRR